MSRDTSRLHIARRAALAAAALAAALAAHAQPAPPAPPAPGAVPPPPFAQPAALEQASATGRLQRWLPNPNGEADGLLLQDGTQIAFPPHLSDALTGWLRAGDTVEVTGWRRADAPVLRASVIRSKGRAVEDTPPAPGTRPPPPRQDALSPLQADGRVARVLVNSRGDAHGVLLEDGTVVRFPPHMAASVTPLLRPGATVSVRGWGTRNALGTGLEAAQLGASPNTLQDMLRGPVARRP